MKKNVLHILLAVVVAGSLVSCHKDGQVIPRNKMCKIYSEMFLADSWILDVDMDVRGRSDTTAFYEPIFNKYGYTTEDYLRSVEYYLRDPERFAKMMYRVRDKLDAELKKLQDEQYKERMALDAEEAESE